MSRKLFTSHLYHNSGRYAEPYHNCCALNNNRFTCLSVGLVGYRIFVCNAADIRRLVQKH
ncbi:hypothetical protein C0J52_08377 [Blattella germanica]|nr:hypothetical protein C0J52_08377 [Blattella germanica]